MSTQHTQGRLVACNPSDTLHAIRDAKGRIVADAGYSGTTDGDTANARRLAACWNACQGIPTEVLETLDVARALRIGDEWKAQRDRLQAVALLAREFIAIDRKDLIDSMTVNGVFQPDEQDKRAIAEYDAIIAQLDAAMAPAVQRLPSDDTEGGAA